MKVFYYYFYLVSCLFIAFAFSQLPMYISFFFSVVLLVLFWSKSGINLVFSIISILLLLLSFTFIRTRKIPLFHYHVFIHLLLFIFYYSFILFFIIIFILWFLPSFR